MMNIRHFTDARLRLSSRIRFSGMSADQVFTVMGDPEKITDWYLLARRVKLHPNREGEEQSFNVEFTFFGDVFEEILHWDPPAQYIYTASGPDFPIKDYVSVIEVHEEGGSSGVMTWNVYFDQIEGDHYRRILPVMLPAVNDASMENLSHLIGGVDLQLESHFDDIV